tara:strand:+ start:669 stop:1682 length:1014 start_codon:yes stop_codon:yes gene_type:complete
MANLIQFEPTDIVNDVQKVVTSTWSDNTNNLQVAFTSSAQAVFGSATSSGAHYIEVYHLATTQSVQYAVAYGHKNGSGSLDFTNDVGAYGNSPSKNIYNQYRQLVFGDEASNFSFNGYTPDDIYVININRARYKHNLKPATLDFKLTGTGGSLELTDDSITQTGSSTITNAGRQFNIVSGSSGVMLGSNLTQVTDSGSYGLFYPDAGFIILNPAALDHTITSLAPTTTANNDSLNHQKLFNHISGGGYFILDSEEKVSSQFYFARAKNNQFNYTTNPSFVDNNGNVNIDSFIDNPTTYITTVGLYNNNNDLVAVAKLSQPVTKDFTKEALIRVKLDY